MYALLPEIWQFFKMLLRALLDSVYVIQMIGIAPLSFSDRICALLQHSYYVATYNNISINIMLCCLQLNIISSEFHGENSKKQSI